ncbi:Cro/CI family transcriptional regulator [Chromatium okenii]|jgi:hypothetical protein|uniref:Cro/CI family transcriptional regulator n=1 Tax=Chromatium okenii TaxID=61644 RepID=UPI0026F203DA|nr:Cro/CI family transcriptional regulator [Chromatium okenii]MBV5308174.1 helix-turn-helix domain-containing protein [Chromatium okenii]
MITKSILLSELGSLAAIAEKAGCSKQAVSQWKEKIPLRSAINLSLKGKWSIYDLRPDIFGPPTTTESTT